MDTHSHYLLSGIATRCAHVAGLHRERNLLKFSPFEAEIRRRLWWQILIMDRRSAQLSGVHVDSIIDTLWDTERPFNVSDSDLSPQMKEPPKPRDGPSEMLLVMIRTEIGEYMREIKSLERNAKIKQTAILPERLSLIDGLEKALKKRFLSQLDPSIPFHLFATLVIQSALTQERFGALIASSDKSSVSTQANRDQMFNLALQSLEYDRLTHSNPDLRGYLWHVSQHFPHQSFIFVLTELVSRTDSADVDAAWICVDNVFGYRPEFIKLAPKNPLFLAIGSLALKAWQKRITSQRRLNPILPNIARLQSRRSLATSPASLVGTPQLMTESSKAKHQVNASILENNQPLLLDQNIEGEIVDIDWESWSQLIDNSNISMFDFNPDFD
jgi:hypothetical protein